MASLVKANEDSPTEPTPLTADEALFLKCAQENDVKTFAELIKTKKVPAYFQNPNTGESAMMLAASKGHGEIISLLIQNGAPWRQ